MKAESRWRQIPVRDPHQTSPFVSRRTLDTILPPVSGAMLSPRIFNEGFVRDGSDPEISPRSRQKRQPFIALRQNGEAQLDCAGCGRVHSHIQPRYCPRDLRGVCKHFQQENHSLGRMTPIHGPVSRIFAVSVFQDPGLARFPSPRALSTKPHLYRRSIHEGPLLRWMDRWPLSRALPSVLGAPH